MKGVLVQTTLHGIEALRKIVKTGVIGINSKPLSYQPPEFKDKPIIFCSYVGGEYKGVYGLREGVIFETEAPVVYACPVDTFDLMRDGCWLPGHERFLFPSIESMLEKYPSPADFKRDFQEFFRSLTPQQVFPNSYSGDDSEYDREQRRFAEMRFETDYCRSSWWTPGCTEVTFPKPLKVKNCRVFSSPEELEKML